MKWGFYRIQLTSNAGGKKIEGNPFYGKRLTTYPRNLNSYEGALAYVQTTPKGSHANDLMQPT
jgi:hypothetical protein